MWKGNAREEASAVCYSYRDRKMEEEARRLAREERRRREERAKKAEKERPSEKERELVRA
jgi:hypothetical protein